MNKEKIILLLVFILIFFSFNSGEKYVREDMIITNIEVPVRVFYKGKLVDGLKKNKYSESLYKLIQS